jgi:HEAT repeat protein
MARSLKLAAAVVFVLAWPAHAQTPDIFEGHAPPARYGSDTLGMAIRHAPRITVLEVDRVDRKRGVIVYRIVATLKGERRSGPERHRIGTDHAQQQMLLSWAKPGRRAVCFHDADCRSVCVGNCWYACDVGEMTEQPGAVVFTEPSTCYAGPVDRLAQHIKDLRAGKEVEITAVTTRGFDSLDLCPPPVERNWLRGKKGRVGRIRVRLSRKGMDFVGWGMTDAEGVPALAAALKSKDELVRAEAAVDLGGIGAQAHAALPALHQALRDVDAFVRVYTAEAIGRIDRRAAPLSPLQSALKEKQPAVRVAACAALASLGHRARPALPGLVAALGDGDERVRCAAAWALGEVGLPPTLPLWERVKVAESLGRVLRLDAHPEARYRSARALLKLGVDAWAAAPALNVALRDDKHIALVAAHVLACLDPPAVPLLSAAYSDQECKVRDNIAEFLGHLGVRARFALPALRATPEGLSVLGWGSAGRAVARIDRTLLPQTALQEIPYFVGEPEGRFCEAKVLELLPQLVKESTAARNELRALLKHYSAVVRVRAAVLLGRSGYEEEAVAFLVKLLDHKLADHRCRAALGLALLGPRARAAIPALRRAAGDRRDAAAGLARVALCLVSDGDRPGWGHDPRRKVLLGLLTAAGLDTTLTGSPLEESDLQSDAGNLQLDAAEVAETAEKVLNILVDEGNAVPRLKSFLRGENVCRRAAAAVALCHLERRSSQAVPVLLGALEERPSLLLFLADALSSLGPRARGLAPWLAQRLRHPNWAVSLAASKVLRGIDPKAVREVWSLGALRRSLRAEELHLLPEEMEASWRRLGGMDAAEGYRIGCRLILAGEPAVVFLAEHLHPVVPVGRERLKRLIADLDSNRFSVRERATVELETLREAAEPALREALRGRPSLEKRRRLEQLIARLDPRCSGVGVRLLRSVEILEQAGTPGAKEVLKAVAEGIPQARLTQEAKAALGRLGAVPCPGR